MFPDPDEPVTPTAKTPPRSLPAAARGPSPRLRPVAKQPGFAISRAPRIFAPVELRKTVDETRQPLRRGVLAPVVLLVPGRVVGAKVPRHVDEHHPRRLLREAGMTRCDSLCGRETKYGADLPEPFLPLVETDEAAAHVPAKVRQHGADLVVHVGVSGHPADLDRRMDDGVAKHLGADIAGAPDDTDPEPFGGVGRSRGSEAMGVCRAPVLLTGVPSGRRCVCVPVSVPLLRTGFSSSHRAHRATGPPGQAAPWRPPRAPPGCDGR